MGKSDRLNAYLENVSGLPFEWGTHDCFTFTNGAFRAMHGVGYADDWMGRYMNGSMPHGKRSMMREFRYSTVDAALTHRMSKVEQPVFGSLVTTKKNQRWVTGVALGICLGSRSVFLSKEGLIRLNVEDVESAWVLK